MNKQITSLQHPIIKHLVKLRQNTDYRWDHQSVLVEGVKPVKEVCLTQHVKKIVAYDDSFLPKGITADETLIVNEAVMKKISGMQTPEGIVAEVAMPKAASLKGLKYIIALDQVSDPGNLGALLRSALALGWQGAFLLNESCDPFNEKAMRAARGATFRLPLATGSWKDLKNIIEENKLQPLVADLHGKSPGELQSKQGVLLVLSNEAHGLSPEAEKICQKVTIPMPGEMESLNVAVAGGILMYEMKKGSQ